MAFLAPLLPAGGSRATHQQPCSSRRPPTMVTRKRKPRKTPASKPSSPSVPAGTDDPASVQPSPVADEDEQRETPVPEPTSAATTPPAPVSSDNDDPASASVQYTTAADLPMEDESRLRLPDAPVSSGGAGVRRRRRKRAGKSGEEAVAEAAEAGEAGEEVPDDYGISELGKGRNAPDGEVDRSAVDAVRRLTSDFRSGSAGAEELLLREIEKDPDFLFQTGNETDEYDLTSAMIGTGTPNKQGVYVNPYVQSGHVLLLVVILLCAFVYYPGFPLTELDIETTDWLKRGLALTYVFNFGLSFASFREAKKRNQPPLFWAAKTAFIGGLAYSELKRNAPTEEEKKKRSASRKRRRAEN